MTGKAKKTTVLLFIVLLASGILNFSLLAEGETAAVKASVSTPNPYNITLHGWKRSHQYSALINLYTFFCQNKTHNPKSRLEFRVIRQTETAIIRRCISALAAHPPKNSEPSAGQGRTEKAFPAWRSWYQPTKQISCLLPTAAPAKPTKRD